ncbi:hypothetical protein BDA99DRAFT_213292 [Phascolomyces articulosus]|uniref:Uncharacterized protein n=1 Tax=Phascolomyces articulosus TaxID=60185 RepID=A0AAD5JQT0_9FUNG|nr:hypothetical protein BDA99DRAFT_213292 [Phascolomyces articulosus]
MSIEPTILENLFIQLIDKGLETGQLDGIIKTLDGQSLLTTQHVHDFLLSWMKEHGRTTTFEIARELNVDQSTILDAWSVLAPQQNWLIADDVLLTSAYIDTIPNELRSLIDQTGGYLSIITLAQHLRLPYVFLSKQLDPMIVSEKYVRLDQISDLILTSNYHEQVKKSILEPLEKAIEPLSMFKLQRSTSLLESQETLFYVLLENIIRDSELEGTFRGRREKSIYVPHSYRDRQISLITSLLEASGYIEYETVEQHYGYSNPKDLLLRHDNEIQLLDTCAITPSLLEKFQNKIENITTTATSSNGYIDMSEHVPFAFTVTDTGSLLDLVIGRIPKKQRPVVLGSRFVTTGDYLKSFVTAAQSFLDLHALQEIQNEKKLHSGKGKKKLYDEKSTVKLTDQEIHDYLAEEQHLNSDFANLAVPVIRRSMQHAFTKALQTVYVAPSTLLSNHGLSGPIQRERDTLRDLRRKIYYSQQSVLLFDDESARKSLEKYIVRQLGLQFLFHVVLLGYFENGEDLGDDIVNTTSEEVMKEKLSTFSKNQNDHYGITDLIPTVLNGKKSDDLVLYLKETPPNFLSTDLLDENAQKETCGNVTKALTDQLENTPVSTSTAPLILHLTSILCFQALYHLPLYVSGKYVPHIIKKISSQLDSHDKQIISDAHTMIMSSRKDPTLFDPTILQNVYDLGLKIK